MAQKTLSWLVFFCTGSLLVPGVLAGQAPEGPPFRVSDGTAAGSAGSPAVAAADGGDGFLVVYQAAPEGLGPGVYGQLFAADGTAIGADLELSAGLDGEHRSPAVAATAGGGFVAVWAQSLPAGEGEAPTSAILRRELSAGGEPAETVEVVAAAEGSPLAAPQVAAGGGAQVIVWQRGEALVEPYTVDVAGRLWLGGGETVDLELPQGGLRLRPAVAIADDGSFTVFWEGEGEGDRSGIHFRGFDPFGTPLDDSLRANLWTRDRQAHAAGVSLGAEDRLAVWQSDEPGAGIAVDLALCIDGSGSVTRDELALQREALAAALEDPSVVPRDATVRLTMLEFAGPGATEVVAPPTVIDSEATARDLAAAVRAVELLGSSTCIACCIQEATREIVEAQAIAPSARQLIDLSADGPPNGRPVSGPCAGQRTALDATFCARDAALAAGIDGLNAILVARGALRAEMEEIYGALVFPPEEALLLFTETFETYELPLARKLSAELERPARDAVIVARRLGSAGEGSFEVQVNSFIEGFQVMPDLAADGAGGLVVVWNDDSAALEVPREPDAVPRNRVSAQWLSRGGFGIGGQRRIDGDDDGDAPGTGDPLGRPRVAALSGSRFVIVWAAAGDGDDEQPRPSDVYARLLAPTALYLECAGSGSTLCAEGGPFQTSVVPAVAGAP